MSHVATYMIQQDALEVKKFIKQSETESKCWFVGMLQEIYSDTFI